MRTTRPKPLWLHLGTIAARLEQAPALAIGSDFDGTLSPIVPHPGDAVLPERTRRVLQRLARLDHVGLAFFSGRTIDDVLPRLGVRGVFIAGAAGLETLDGDGVRATGVPAGAELPTALGDEMREWVERFPGAWLEDKTHSIALHYRHVASDKQAAFDAGVRRRHRRFSAQARLVHGKKVFELMPAVALDKATALRQWMSTIPQGALPFYFGDDTNDEPALRLMDERGGISVAVGRVTSHARFALESPADLTWFLEWLEREWTERHAALRPIAGTVGEEGLL